MSPNNEISVRREATPAGAVLENLTREERSEFRENEKIIQEGLHTFVEVGNALLTIRDKRLYRADFAAFDEYCRTRWGMSKTHANRLISSATVATSLAERTGVQPLNEGQLRPLTKLDPATQKKVWAQVVKKTSIPGEISASMVRDMIEQVTGEPAIDRGYRPQPKRDPSKELVSRGRMLDELNLWWGKHSSRMSKAKPEEVFIALKKIVGHGV